MNYKIIRGMFAHTSHIPCRRIAFVTRVALILLMAGLVTIGQSSAAGAGAPTCEAATVSASPQVVNYRTVMKDTEEHRSEPDFTVFIELPNGSAADIDPGSITLNGLRALPEPGALGDANRNGIADLMVKFNRSVLITTDGLLRVTGKTRSGGCFAGETSVEILCLPVGVDRSDYSIEFTTSDMPDSQFDGLQAQLDVHRVKPVFPRGCPNISPIKALVLVHGRTIPATASFDLQYQDYSLMERLAMRGIDTFAANHLGLGFSSLPSGSNPLNEPCNASLPQCTAQQYNCSQCTPTSCSPPAGVCDCQGLPAIQTMDQQGLQGSRRYLNPNPLTAPCPHKSNTRFQRVTDQVVQLDLIVDDALAKTGLAKVHLLGYSFGGPVVGKYLGDDPCDETHVCHQNKVAGAIFLASTFGGGPEQASPTWPLGLIDRTDAMSNFNLAGPTCRPGDGCVSSGCTNACTSNANCLSGTCSGGFCMPDPDCEKGLTGCPGQQDPAIQDPIWTTIKARDLIGPGWGPQPSGLSRYPIVPRFDWNPTVTSKIEVPALVMNGLKDSVVRVNASVEIYNSLASTSKVIRQLDCASHALVWEGCSGESCVAPHESVQMQVGDWILTGMVFASPGQDNGSFETAADGTLTQTSAPYEPVTVDGSNER